MWKVRGSTRNSQGQHLTCWIDSAHWGSFARARLAALKAAKRTAAEFRRSGKPAHQRGSVVRAYDAGSDITAKPIETTTFVPEEM